MAVGAQVRLRSRSTLPHVARPHGSPDAAVFISRKLSEDETGTEPAVPEPTIHRLNVKTRGKYGVGDAALSPEDPPPHSPPRAERREKGEYMGMANCSCSPSCSSRLVGRQFRANSNGAAEGIRPRAGFLLFRVIWWPSVAIIRCGDQMFPFGIFHRRQESNLRAAKARPRNLPLSCSRFFLSCLPSWTAVAGARAWLSVPQRAMSFEPCSRT